ncbi:MAG: hypothetical protein M3P85_05825 [Actinomycetota bacterium]|nr:hypothetical protein [Actinomycetota bacterium]
MRSRLLKVALVALATSVVPLARPALADGSSAAWNNGDSIGAGASSGGATAGASTGGRAGGGSGAKPVCTYEALAPEFQRKADGMAKNGWEDEPGDGPGLWYRKSCTEANGSSSGTVVWIPTRAAVDPAVLAQQALQNTAIPAPLVGMNPRPTQPQVVNLPTWLWIDPAAWAPVSATASAGGVTVRTTAGPQSVIWDMGNGEKMTCDGPGKPYNYTARDADQHPTCSYTYRHSSATATGGVFPVTATVVWRVRWTVVGGAGGGDLGTASRTATVAVRVAEIQAVNRPAGGGD